MKPITYGQLLNLIRKCPGLLMVGLYALTDAKALKTGNPFPGKLIFKQIVATGIVGADYESAVNREANRQGGQPEFDAESLPWGSWLIPGKVIEHTDKAGNYNLYLRTQTTPGNRRTVPAKVICYRNASGHILTKAEVSPFLPPVLYESNKQREETGINETVWVRTYKFSSIRKIRIAGITYTVLHP